MLVIQDCVALATNLEFNEFTYLLDRRLGRFGDDIKKNKQCTKLRVSREVL